MNSVNAGLGLVTEMEPLMKLRAGDSWNGVETKPLLHSQLDQQFEIGPAVNWISQNPCLARTLHE